MSMSVRKLCQWKLEDGYFYMYIDEDTRSINFLRKDELEPWLMKKYAQYRKGSAPAMHYSAFCRANMPDKITDMLQTTAAQQNGQAPVCPFMKLGIRII